MNCLINPLIKDSNNNQSELHVELYEVFGQEKANQYYALVQSEQFKKDFGDWTNWDNHKGMIDRIETNGEPKLFFNDAKNLYYFKLENGEKYYLDNNYINLDSEQKKALINNTIQYISGDVLFKEDLANVEFSKIYEADDNNLAYLVLNGQTSALRELEQEVRNFYNVSTREYSDEVGSSEEEREQDNAGLGLLSSVEKNSKDNASANIKFMFSYIPKFNSDGELQTVEIPDPITGDNIELVDYMNYHEIWNYFEETLANIYPQIEGANYVDGFEIMLQRLRAKYGLDAPYFNPSVNYLIDADNGLLTQFPDFKKKQFFLAFSKTKVNFYTTTINKDDGLTLSFFNSGEVTARYKKVSREYELGIQNGPLVNASKQTYNTEEANKIYDKYKILKDKVGKRKFTINEVTEYAQKMFRAAGIGVSKTTLLNYFEATKPTKNVNAEVMSLHKAGVALDKLEFIFQDLSKATSDSVFTASKYKSPITVKTALEDLAKTEAEFRKDISENTLLGPDNKKYWAYSLPNYLNTKLKRIKSDIALESSFDGFYENSVWLEYLSRKDGEFDQFKSNFDVLRFLNLKLEQQSDAGVDNKSVSPVDQMVDMFNKALMIRSNYDYSIINTPTPADKATSQNFKVNSILDSGFDIDEAGNYVFADSLKKVYKGYLKDEMNRINNEFDTVMLYKELQDNINSTEDETLKEQYQKDLDNLKESLYQYYHYGKDEQLFTEKDGKLIPAGNFFKFTLFDELNIDSENFMSINNKLLLYDMSDDVDVVTPIMDTNKVDTHPEIDRLIDKKLTELLEDSVKRLEDARIVDVNRTEVGSQSKIQSIDVKNLVDKKIFDYYITRHGGNRFKAGLDFIFESTINQHHANIEYNKVFSGDYAFYKNLDDYSKRVPATYTDGILPVLEPGVSPTYNMAVMPDVKVDSELYLGIDATDAQGYITFDRWKFLTRRLNKYSPKVEEIIQRFEKGTQTSEDYKFAAQPLKGVYFDNNQGIPTYVKYSALPLIPSATKGFKIDKLRENMESQGIDEAVALSGVKVGAVTTSEMMDKNNQFLDKMKFFPQTLNNHSWKLQQDLSPKGMKNTLLGSQMQWNLMGDLEDSVVYGNKTGLEIRESINELISKLSDKNLDILKEEIGLDVETGKISNREAFYNALLDEMLSNGGDLNSIEALKREYPLDYILTNRAKFQNLISAVINNATVKIKTNGGSFIQASSHQWEIEEGIDESQLGDVVMLTDTKKLEAPREVDGKVMPGQIFISHQEISKYIPNYKELAKEGKLKDMIDDKLRYIVGYRIPNQDLASNDALEIVGILPESMGDTVLPYIDITTKTGSDFDIDKMYLFLPNIKPVEKNGEVVRLEYYEDTDSETIKGIENKLLEEFINVLTAQKLFKSLTKSIDNDEHKNDLKKLHGIENVKLNPFTFFNPLYQVEKKFDNSAGKAGTGIWANNKVDHVKAQIAKLSMNEDLGVGNVKDGVTQLDGIYDSRGKKDGLRIGEMISLFLTANVDIAKDPYITKGNYTPVTYNTAALLVRAGTPYKWMNRFMGQPIIKRFAELEAVKDSRVNPIKENVTSLLEKELWSTLKKVRGTIGFDEWKEDKSEGIDKLVVDGEAIRKHKKFTESYMEKSINTEIPSGVEEKITYYLDQLMYLKLYDRYNKIANKFNSTIVNSKADVNGAKQNFMANHNYLNKYNNMFDFTSETQMNDKGNKLPLFNNLKKKFDDTFLGTKHKNSTELASRIFANELITANESSKSIYETYSNIKPYADENELVKLESALFGFIASKNSFLKLSESGLRDLLTTDKLFNKVSELKIKYPDNTLLEYLEFDKVEGLRMLKMDNFKNKPNTLKDDLIKSWMELHEKETNFSESLIKYAYATSNFQFNSNSFFEYIPYNVIKDVVGNTVDFYRRESIESTEFFSFLFRHNPDLAPEVSKVDGKTPFLNTKEYGAELIISDQLSPYLKNVVDNKPILYERATPLTEPYFVDSEGKNKYVYIRKSTLGYKQSGYSIYEHDMPETSIFNSNRLNKRKDVIFNLDKKLNELHYEHIVNASTTDVTGYYLQPKEITPEQLRNINRVLTTPITIEEFNELTRTEQEYIINCHG